MFDSRDKNVKLCDVLQQDGTWNFQRLYTAIPTDLMKELQRSYFQLSHQKYQILWNETSHGRFSSQSPYRTLLKQYLTGTRYSRNWKWLWFSKLNNKLKHFVWLAAQERLATNSVRFHRKFAENANCSQCHCSEEDVIHILRHCPAARKVWKSLLSLSDLVIFDITDDADWIKQNIFLNSSKMENHFCSSHM